MDVPPLSQAKEIVLTAAEKQALIQEEKRQLLAQKALQEDKQESTKEKKSSEESGRQKKGDEGEAAPNAEPLDERMLREINKRVKTETATLRDEIRDLKEVCESLE